jgi:hypothetical protein
MFLVAGCGSAASPTPPPAPAPICEEMELAGQPVLTCEEAVAAAVGSLVSHPTITELRFTYGSLCPPNARCIAPDGTAGTVIVSFANDTQVSIYVSIAGGELVVDPPQPYPPPT